MSDIKETIRVFFRDIPTTLLILVGLVLSYFVAINGISFMNTISYEQEKKNSSGYDNRMSFMVDFCIPPSYKAEDEGSYREKIATFVSEFETDTGNLIVNSYNVIMGDSMDGEYTKLFLSKNEKIKEKIISGRMPTEEEIESKSNVVLLSKEYKKYTVQKDGETQIRFGDTYFKVTGFFETNDTTQDRRNIILFKEAFSDKVINNFIMRIFEQGYMNIEYVVNNEEILAQSYSKLLNIVKKNGFIVTEDLFADGDAVYNKKAKFNRMFLYILFLSSMINCMVISGVWIQKRFKELVVRKTMGYSMGQIIWLLAVDLFKYSILSLILAFTIQMIYSGILTGDKLRIRYFMQNSVYILGSMAIVIIGTLIIPLIKLKRVVPAGNIR